MLDWFRAFLQRHKLLRALFVGTFIVMAVVTSPLWLFMDHCWVVPLRLLRKTMWLGPEELWGDPVLQEAYELDDFVKSIVRRRLTIGVAVPAAVLLGVLTAQLSGNHPYDYLAGIAVLVCMLLVLATSTMLAYVDDEVWNMQLRLQRSKPQTVLF